MKALKSLKRFFIFSTLFLIVTSFQSNKHYGLIELQDSAKGSSNSTPIADSFMQYITSTSSFIQLFNDNKSNKMRFIFVFQKESSNVATGTNHYTMKMYLWVSGGLFRKKHYVECAQGTNECTTKLTATTEVALDNPTEPGTHEPFTLTVLEIRKADMLEIKKYFDNYDELTFIPYYDVDKTAKIPFVNLRLDFTSPRKGGIKSHQIVDKAANPVPPKPPVK